MAEGGTFRDKTFEQQLWEKKMFVRKTGHEIGKDLTVLEKESDKMPTLKDEASLRIVWARIETLTIDCLTHIRRGNVKKDDPLWTLLRKWFIRMDTQLSPMISR